MDNLGFIVRNGLLSANFPGNDPSFRRIGDSSLIQTREGLNAPNPPGGSFQDYIPFYLGPRPPTLYKIAKGHEDIEQLPQHEIIYLISSVEVVIQNGLTYFFSDGHARAVTSNFYTDQANLDNLDWETIYSNQWYNTPSDMSRKQRKQAEFFVKDFMPWNCIEMIGVFNNETKKRVQNVLNTNNEQKTIKVAPKKLYYADL